MHALIDLTKEANDIHHSCQIGNAVRPRKGESLALADRAPERRLATTPGTRFDLYGMATYTMTDEAAARTQKRSTEAKAPMGSGSCFAKYSAPAMPVARKPSANSAALIRECLTWS